MMCAMCQKNPILPNDKLCLHCFEKLIDLENAFVALGQRISTFLPDPKHALEKLQAAQLAIAPWRTDGSST